MAEKDDFKLFIPAMNTNFGVQILRKSAFK